ncbi:MAG: tetraacyldisaccharide 4'-kinase [Flavobacteriales bacterium]|nr:tetraacyldisaccharide 4'-kinase [Flavobacteriales bacterium]
MGVQAKYGLLLRRLLLWPATAVYGGILHLRHALYDRGLLTSTRPTVPTIAVGNLSLGGTGKTPHVELILRSLEGFSPLATLSRGYGRKGTGFQEVLSDDTAAKSGDEPLQIARKFPQVRVFVGADRVNAVAAITAKVPDVKAVVLDDALQHRSLNAGLNILLTTWTKPFSNDALLPAGTLRDLRGRARAAGMVIVTKCPGPPNAVEQQKWRTRLHLKPEQVLYFSAIAYDAPNWLLPTEGYVPVGQGVSALLFTGIADPDPLAMHARTLWGRVDHLAFPDHHPFSPSDLRRLAGLFSSFAADPKVLVTTEKDAMRLRSVIAGSPLEGLPIAVIGMRVEILNEPEHFASLLRDHVDPHPAHR